MSKVDAGQKFAQGKYDQKMAKYEMGNQARSNFINSLTGIATDSLTQRSDLIKNPEFSTVMAKAREGDSASIDNILKGFIDEYNDFKGFLKSYKSKLI